MQRAGARRGTLPRMARLKLSIVLASGARFGPGKAEIAVTSSVENSDEAERPTGFLPNKAVKGLEPSDDPFFAARAATYSLAFGRRNP